MQEDSLLGYSYVIVAATVAWNFLMCLYYHPILIVNLRRNNSIIFFHKITAVLIFN